MAHICPVITFTQFPYLQFWRLYGQDCVLVCFSVWKIKGWPTAVLWLLDADWRPHCKVQQNRSTYHIFAKWVSMASSFLLPEPGPLMMEIHWLQTGAVRLRYFWPRTQDSMTAQLLAMKKTKSTRKNVISAKYRVVPLEREIKISISFQLCCYNGEACLFINPESLVLLLHSVQQSILSQIIFYKRRNTELAMFSHVPMFRTISNSSTYLFTYCTIVKENFQSFITLIRS